MLPRIKPYRETEKNGFMSIENKVIAISFIVALLIWVVDSTIDYFAVYEDVTFLELLFTKVPKVELFMRFFVVVCVISCGLIISNVIGRLRHTEKTKATLKEKRP